ncbi:MAG TPA: hypothetical protein VGD46_19390 [Rhizobacter sp.]
MATVTAVAALAAGALLAAEDRVLFEPHHALLVGVADDLGEFFLGEPAARATLETRPAASRVGGTTPERR